MLLSVEEAADRLGIGRTTMWMLIRRGEIASIHVGRLRRIEPEALAAYIASDASRTLTQPPDASWSV
jgi:excisionase family DNA binding protein